MLVFSVKYNPNVMCNTANLSNIQQKVCSLGFIYSFKELFIGKKIYNVYSLLIESLRQRHIKK